jgi:hypothetical protein
MDAVAAMGCKMYIRPGVNVSNSFQLVCHPRQSELSATVSEELRHEAAAEVARRIPPSEGINTAHTVFAS